MATLFHAQRGGLLPITNGGYWPTTVRLSCMAEGGHFIAVQHRKRTGQVNRPTFNWLSAMIKPISKRSVCMSFLETYGKEIFAVIVATVPWLLDRFKGKARLQYSQSHSHNFLVQQPLFNREGELVREMQTANTSSFIVYNAGRETSTKVEIVFNWKPIYNIWPLRHYTEHMMSDNLCHCV